MTRPAFSQTQAVSLKPKPFLSNKEGKPCALQFVGRN